MIEVHSIDLLSIMLYICIGFGAVVLLSRRTPYLRARYRIGSVSLFIIAMTVALTGLSGMMGTAVWYRIMDILNVHSGMWYNIHRFLWTVASILTAVGMWLLVLIDSEDLYSTYLKIKRNSQGDVVDEQSVRRPDEEVRTEPERFE